MILGLFKYYKQYKQAVADLENKLHQATIQYDSEKALIESLNNLQNEVHTLPSEAHEHLKSQLRNVSDWSQLKGAIQKEYSIWLNNHLSNIIKKVVCIYEMLEIQNVQEFIISVKAIIESLSHECLTAQPNPHIMYNHESGYVNAIIYKIETITNESISEIDAILIPKFKDVIKHVDSSKQRIEEIKKEIKKTQDKCIFNPKSIYCCSGIQSINDDEQIDSIFGEVFSPYCGNSSSESYSEESTESSADSHKYKTGKSNQQYSNDTSSIFQTKSDEESEEYSKSITDPISYSSVLINNSKANTNSSESTCKSDSKTKSKETNHFGHSIGGTMGSAVAACGAIPGFLPGRLLGANAALYCGSGGLLYPSKNQIDTQKSDSFNTLDECQNKEYLTPAKVNSAVYAPSEVNRDDSVIIQVYVYKPSEEYKIAKVASDIDEDATRRNYTPLTSMVKKGDKIRLLLRSYSRNIEIEESSHEGIWANELFKHEFIAYVPGDFSKSNFLCSVNILINDIPVGDMKFKVSVVDHRPRKLWTEIKNNGYKKSFISYSHADAEKIRFLAEGFRIQSIDYFFDEHSLRTGDNYPKEIDEYISTCDVFVLCWSENAKTSDWVNREYNMALQRYERESDNIKIYPISIVPKAELPSNLRSKFHFGIIE